MVVNVRSAVSVGLIWLAAVAGVSGTAWIAIDRAGRDITNGSVSSLSPLTVVNAPAATTPGSGASSTEVTTSPTAKPTKPEPSPTLRSTVSPIPSASPTSAPAPSPTPARDGTFHATGGQITVRCTGGTIQLRIAQPDDTWRVEVGSVGPQEVHVTFMRGGEEGVVGTQVTAVCAGGAPVFRVASDN